MKASDVPTMFNIPFADTGLKNPIPEASQILVAPGRASLTDGFVPLNFVAVASGGIPPFGQDANGIFFEITSWDRWCSAGAPIYWNAAFAAATGYPAGAILQKTDGSGNLWRSTVDDNPSNPDTGGANWAALDFGGSGGFGIGLGLRNDGSGNAETAQPETGIATTVNLALGDHTARYTASAPLTINAFQASVVNSFNGFYIDIDARGGDVTFQPFAGDSVAGGTPGAAVAIPQGTQAHLVIDHTLHNWQLTAPGTAILPGFVLMAQGII